MSHWTLRLEDAIPAGTHPNFLSILLEAGIRADGRNIQDIRDSYIYAKLRAEFSPDYIDNLTQKVCKYFLDYQVPYEVWFEVWKDHYYINNINWGTATKSPEDQINLCKSLENDLFQKYLIKETGIRKTKAHDLNIGCLQKYAIQFVGILANIQKKPMPYLLYLAFLPEELRRHGVAVE